MRTRSIAVLVACLAAAAGLIPSTVQAESDAETGNALEISATGAELNGVVNPTEAHSVWFFEYATTPNFGAGDSTTEPVPVSGPAAVEATVTGLTPGTVYYFRVVVDAKPDATMAPEYNLGDAAQFTTLNSGSTQPTTPRYGVGSLTNASLMVSRTSAAVVMHCQGETGVLCTAKVALSATSRGRTIGCGTGQFIASAPHTHTIRVHPTAACLGLVARAKQKRLRARFTARFSTDQRALRKTVTLVG